MLMIRHPATRCDVCRTLGLQCGYALKQEAYRVGLAALERCEGLGDSGPRSCRCLLPGVSLIDPADVVSRNLADWFLRFGSFDFPTHNRFFCCLFCTVLYCLPYRERKSARVERVSA